jgi:hypothetical protein
MAAYRAYLCLSPSWNGECRPGLLPERWAESQYICLVPY